MRLKQYINGTNIFEDYLCLYESLNIDEMSNDTFNKLKEVGKKVGFKIEKKKSLIDYFKGVNKGVEDLLRYASLYMLTDIKDSESRKELTDDAKEVFKRINKKDLTNMLLQLDKATIGSTSHIRHILHSVFGIDISTYGNWLKDAEWLKKTINDIRIVLNRMGDTGPELKALDDFEKSLENLLT